MTQVRWRISMTLQPIIKNLLMKILEESTSLDEFLNEVSYRFNGILIKGRGYKDIDLGEPMPDRPLTDEEIAQMGEDSTK